MQVLLLDEITVDMDVVGRLDLLKFFVEECETRGATIIYATHIFDGLERWITHVAYLADGHLRIGEAAHGALLGGWWCRAHYLRGAYWRQRIPHGKHSSCCDGCCKHRPVNDADGVASLPRWKPSASRLSGGNMCRGSRKRSA